MYINFYDLYAILECQFYNCIENITKFLINYLYV